LYTFEEMKDERLPRRFEQYLAWQPFGGHPRLNDGNDLHG
jgi:hypothetical protein